MKFDVPRKEFYEAVSAAAAASSVRTSVTILQHLKIDATEGAIRVLGCDSEMWVERIVPCMVTEAGSVCIQAKLLNDLVSSMPEGDISIKTVDDSGVLMTQAASEYRMLAQDPADFPEPPQFEGEAELNLEMGVLRNAVDSVIYAASTDNHRLVLTGVLFIYDGQVLTLVATDTHRLAVRRVEQAGIGTDINAVVPEKALKAIKALPVADDQKVQIQFSHDRLGVEANGAKVVSQLLAGTYPNWERVVPSEVTRYWSVEADQLLEKVKRTMILARDNANRVRFKGHDDQILISAHSDEKGEAKEEVPMVGQNGSVEIAFNGRYVQDALVPIAGPGVKIEMTESTRPAVFRSAENEASYFCVIMPMALN
jgi:DNA polymerase III subunit beta